MILIGFFCAGKSSVGQLCAKKMQLDFIDTDCELEKKFQKKAHELYLEIGDEAFRREELHVVKAQQNKNVFLSTGGGTILLKETRDLLKEMGEVVYLKATLETLWERMEKKRFPSFIKSKESFKKKAEDRFPIYESMAERIIQTDDKLLEEVVEEVYGQ